MKKQILVLTVLIMALFLSSNMSYGQLNVENDFLTAAPTCPTAVPLTCATGTAVSPIPGTNYPYTITVSDMGTVHWFVTDNPAIMAGATFPNTADVDPGDGTGDYILLADAAYNAPGNTSLTVNISWKPFDGVANTVLLVAYTINAAGCTDNIEVYRIVPAYSFTLDIAGLLDAGTAGDTECVGAIQSATYDGTDLNVIYGNNYIFYIVTAANWQTSWEPTFSAATALAGSSVTSAEWAYADEATITGAWNATGTPVLASHYGATNGFVGVDGECIVIRVLLDHTLTESLAPELVTLSIDGEMVNPETGTYDGTYPDLDEGTPTCVDNVTDTFVYTITPRATMTAVTPAFEPKNP